MDAVAGHELTSITQTRVPSGGRAFSWALGVGIVGLLATGAFFLAGGRVAAERTLPPGTLRAAAWAENLSGVAGVILIGAILSGIVKRD